MSNQMSFINSESSDVLCKTGAFVSTPTLELQTCGASGFLSPTCPGEGMLIFFSGCKMSKDLGFLVLQSPSLSIPVLSIISTLEF